MAAVTVTRAELAGSTLRIEGTAAASRDILVDGMAWGRSDASGQFEIRRDGYTPPHDCTVDLTDGSATVTPTRRSGCITSQPPSPPDTTAPTPPADLTATPSGSTVSLTWTAGADDVGVVGYRVSRNGAGLATAFTVEVTDNTGATSRRSFTVRVLSPSPDGTTCGEHGTATAAGPGRCVLHVCGLASAPPPEGRHG